MSATAGKGEVKRIQSAGSAGKVIGKGKGKGKGKGGRAQKKIKNAMVGCVLKL